MNMYTRAVKSSLSWAFASTSTPDVWQSLLSVRGSDNSRAGALYKLINFGFFLVGEVQLAGFDFSLNRETQLTCV